jgi:hypothetical protein
VLTEEKLKDVVATVNILFENPDPFQGLPDFRVSVSKFKFAASEEEFKCDFTELQGMRE